jgi:hypothetical protein
MAASFEFPPVSVDRRQMQMLRTPLPSWDDDQVGRWSAAFGIRGKTRDAGSRLVMRDGRGTLEIFRASDSFRWARQTRETQEVGGKVSLPDERQATGLAQAYLRDRGLADDRAAITSVSYTELCRAERGEGDAAPMQIALHVNFSFTLDGLPVMGPGAKAQVTFDGSSRVREAYKFWREPIEAGHRRIVEPEAAIELLRGDDAFADLREGEARVTFHRIRLGYYALPPREVQGYLIPVYAFDGTVTTRQFERYDFTKHVVAVRVEPEEAKRIGAIRGAPRAIL